MTITELKAAIETKKTEIKEKQAEIDSFELTVSDDEYDYFLDSLGEVNVCGIEFLPSDIIKNCDPIAYRCGKSDYESGIDLNEVEEYRDLLSELQNLESELEDLETELEESEDAYTKYSFFIGSLSDDELREEADDKGLFLLPGQGDDDIRSELLEIFENNN